MISQKQKCTNLPYMTHFQSVWDNSQPQIVQYIWDSSEPLMGEFPTICYILYGTIPNHKWVNEVYMGQIQYIWDNSQPQIVQHIGRTSDSPPGTYASIIYT